MGAAFCVFTRDLQLTASSRLREYRDPHSFARANTGFLGTRFLGPSSTSQELSLLKYKRYSKIRNVFS